MLLTPNEVGVCSIILGIYLLIRSSTFVPFYHFLLKLYPELTDAESKRLAYLCVNQFISIIILAMSLLIILLFPLLYSSTWTVKFEIAGSLVLMLFSDCYVLNNLTVLNAENNHTRYSIASALDAIIRGSLGIFAIVFYDSTFESFILGTAIGSFISSFTIFINNKYLHLYFKFTPYLPLLTKDQKNKIIEFRIRMFKFSLPLVPMSILNWIATFSDRYIMQNEIGLNPVGYYTSMSSLGSQPIQLIQQSTELYFRQKLYDAISKKDIKTANIILNKWKSIIIVFGMLVSIFYLFFGTSVFRFLLSDNYSNFSNIAVVISLSYCFYSVGQIGERTLMGCNKSKLVLAIQMVLSTLNAILVYIGILFWGVWGAAPGLLIGFLIYSIILGVTSRRQINNYIKYLNQ